MDHFLNSVSLYLMRTYKDGVLFNYQSLKYMGSDDNNYIFSSLTYIGTKVIIPKSEYPNHSYQKDGVNYEVKHSLA